MKYASDPKVASDVNRIGHLTHWLSYFGTQLKVLVEYIPNIQTFITQLDKKYSYLLPIVKNYSNNLYTLQINIDYG